MPRSILFIGGPVDGKHIEVNFEADVVHIQGRTPDDLPTYYHVETLAPGQFVGRHEDIQPAQLLQTLIGGYKANRT